MPYVARDSAGKIIALYEQEREDAREHLASDHGEVQEYIAQVRHIDAAKDILSSSDIETVRVIEDLVQVLMDKNLLMLTDLPLAAQRKLRERQNIRQELNAIGNLMVDEHDIL